MDSLDWLEENTEIKNININNINNNNINNNNINNNNNNLDLDIDIFEDAINHYVEYKKIENIREIKMVSQNNYKKSSVDLIIEKNKLNKKNKKKYK